MNPRYIMEDPQVRLRRAVMRHLLVSTLSHASRSHLNHPGGDGTEAAPDSGDDGAEDRILEDGEGHAAQNGLREESTQRI